MVNTAVPVLSIGMISYNHERYVRQAIESVFSQHLPFQWEFIISDDASTDRTADIISEMVAGRPNITFHRQSTNLGMQRNYAFVMERCQGRYVCQLEGDDYWIDTGKSMKQVEMLKAHPQMTWCCTNGIEVDAEGNMRKDHIFNLPASFDLKYFATHFFNPLNNSVMFRKICDPLPYPAFIYGVAQIDTVLHFLRGRNGTIGFIPDSTLAYRKHGTSHTFSKASYTSKGYHDWMTVHKELRFLLPPEVTDTFSDRPAYRHLAEFHLIHGQSLLFWKYLVLSFGHPTIKDSLHYVKQWVLGRTGYDNRSE